MWFPQITFRTGVKKSATPSAVPLTELRRFCIAILVRYTRICGNVEVHINPEVRLDLLPEEQLSKFYFQFHFFSRLCNRMNIIMCDKSHKTCSCTSNSSYPSVQQTLDELEFSRGIWTSALDGSYEEVETFLERKGVHPNAVDSSGYTALVNSNSSV